MSYVKKARAKRRWNHDLFVLVSRSHEGAGDAAVVERDPLDCLNFRTKLLAKRIQHLLAQELFQRNWRQRLRRWLFTRRDECTDMWTRFVQQRLALVSLRLDVSDDVVLEVISFSNQGEREARVRTHGETPYVDRGIGRRAHH